MQIHLSPRHLTLTASIHAFVADKITHLEQLTDRILAAHVVLMHDETKTKKHIVKVHLAVPGPDIHAEAAHDDLYAAIDGVVAKLSMLLRKRKTKTNSHKKHLTQLAVEAEKRAISAAKKSAGGGLQGQTRGL